MSGNLLYFEVAEEIENKINKGIYEEGEKLPSERELTQSYNVSRNVIRQALTILR
ncbi:GntR family transcriptional regulator [Peribacillus sp. NPDC097895]